MWWGNHLLCCQNVFNGEAASVLAMLKETLQLFMKASHWSNEGLSLIIPEAQWKVMKRLPESVRGSLGGGYLIFFFSNGDDP